jgi:predicted metalloprotease with PDZ domain
MKRFLALLLFAPAFACADIHYTLAPHPETGDVAVTVTANNQADQAKFVMPAWVPGFYVILHHEKTVADVKATDGNGKPLTIEAQADPRAWVVDDPSHSPITFSYRVKGTDPGLGFFGVNVRPNTAFVLGGACFMYMDGRKEEATSLKITNPSGWLTGTSMNSGPDGVYHARDYDEFIDHPIDLGHFVKREFTAEGIPFEIDFVTLDTLYPDAQADEMTGRISKLVVPAMQMFGKAPFHRYVFHLHFAVGNFSGGLEHQASVTIALPPRVPANQVDDLVTHEFFHAWNVKNIRPVVLGPFDYTKEVRTDNLWFAEGVTDYYAKVDAYRSGLDSMDDYLFPAFSGELRTYQIGRTRLAHTLAEASRGAWEGFSEGMGDLSYYNKGQLAGWILDAEIRKDTNGQKSFDDVMRYMYGMYHLPDAPGYPENGILLAVNAVAGQDLSALYNKLIYSTDELPYKDLEDIGIRVVATDEEYQDLGFTTDASGVVQDVDESVSQQGLQSGDKVVSIDGKRYGPVVYGLKQSGYTVNVHRSSGEVTLHLKPVTMKADRYTAMPDPFATEEEGHRLEQWLQRPGGIE